MPRRRRHRRDSEDRPDPLVIQRGPELYDSPSRPRRDDVFIVEQTVRRRHRGRERGVINTILIPRRGRTSSSSPPPPIIRRTNIRTVSPSRSPPAPPPPPPPPPPPASRRRVRIASPPVIPIRRRRMSPKPGDRGFVPLPPRVPVAEEHVIDPPSGRQSRQSRDEDIVEIEPEGSHRRRRSPRPYHRTNTSDPFREQERVIDSRVRPVPEEEHYEIIQPHEPVRSRQRQNDIRRSKEYREMKELAEANFKAAQEATERYSSAEVRLQRVTEQLAASELREARARERQEKLQRDLEIAQQALNTCRRERQIEGRERDLDARQSDFDRRRRGAGHEVGRGSRIPLTIHQDDMTPRTITRAPVEDDDPTRTYIAQAQADAAKRGGRT